MLEVVRAGHLTVVATPIGDRSMPVTRRFALLALVLGTVPVTVPAQEIAPLEPPASAAPRISVTTSEPSIDARPSGPRMETARAGVRALAPVVSRTAPAPMRRADSKQSRTYMILGGAALLGGAIIGDDVGSIIMLGGLGVGLYGLYLYLQ